MRSFGTPIIIVAIAFLTSSTVAQTTNACEGVYANAVTHKTTLQRDFTYNEFIFDKYCSADGSTKSFSLDSAGEMAIQGIPYKGSLGIKDSKQRLQTFCREYAGFKQTTDYLNYKNIDPDQGALKSFNECEALLQQGVEVTHTYDPQTPDIATIRVAFNPASSKVVLSSLQTSGDVNCSTNDIEPKALILTNKRRYSLSRTTLISCKRGAASSYGSKSYLAGGVQLGLNSLTYSMVLPDEGILGPTHVAQAQKQIADLQAALNAANTSLQSSQRQWDGKVVKVGHIIRSSFWGRGLPNILFIGCADPATYYDSICTVPANGLRQADTVFSTGGGSCGSTLVTVTCVTPGG
jgi:hypothetical protein